jgi:hypothetical protein
MNDRLQHFFCNFKIWSKHHGIKIKERQDESYPNFSDLEYDCRIISIAATLLFP